MGLPWDWGDPLGLGIPRDRALTFRKEEDGKVPKVVETPAPGCCWTISLSVSSWGQPRQGHPKIHPMGTLGTPLSPSPTPGDRAERSNLTVEGGERERAAPRPLSATRCHQPQPGGLQGWAGGPTGCPTPGKALAHLQGVDGVLEGAEPGRLLQQPRRRAPRCGQREGRDELSSCDPPRVSTRGFGGIWTSSGWYQGISGGLNLFRLVPGEF